MDLSINIEGPMSKHVDNCVYLEELVVKTEEERGKCIKWCKQEQQPGRGWEV